MKYFAYGSNMFEARVKHKTRAPSAVCVGVAILSGCQMRFHKIGMDGSAKCNALVTGNMDDSVYGVVFDISEQDIAVLDEEEDVRRGGYSRKQVNVTMLEDSAECIVECYHAGSDFIDARLRPFDWYNAFVVAGAQEHRLPYDYIGFLAACPSIQDSNKWRSRKAEDILGPSYRQYLESRVKF